MTDSEQYLAEALEDLADHAPSGPAPMDELFRLGRRRRHARSAFAAAAAVTGVTGVGVLAALATGATHAVTPAEAAGGTASPRPVTLALAAASTDAAPFHFRITAKTTRTPAGPGSTVTSTSVTEGAFDPSTTRGYVQSSGGMTNAETIQIGDSCYAQAATGARWIVLPCSATDGPSLVGLSRNPSAVLAMLEADGQATKTGQSGSGSGASETWKFTLTEKPRASAGSVVAGFTATGTAQVSVAGGQITAIDYTLRPDPGSLGPKLPADAVESVSIAFSDYGAPVDVTAPVPGSTGAGSR